ncbi:MAG: hypothetical protein ACRDZ5_08965 [Acidimicrobiales bacterium]
MISGDSLFVPLDSKGTSEHDGVELAWPLPPISGGPGEWLRPPDHPAVPLWTLDGLLESLGESIFLAEPEGLTSEVPDTSLAVGTEGVALARAARLVSETAWDSSQAASFALSCAEHVAVRVRSPMLDRGASLGDVLVAARRALSGVGGDEGLLGLVSRLATARRLRRSAGEVADLAFSVTIADEAVDIDALDDPEWDAIAAVRDAVLAAVEAVRHQAFPHLLGAEATRHAHDDDATRSPGGPVSTPWGAFVPGLRGGVVPAYVAAREAAEHARWAAADHGRGAVADPRRGSVADKGGAEPTGEPTGERSGEPAAVPAAEESSGGEERAWQRGMLLSLLRGGPDGALPSGAP